MIQLARTSQASDRLHLSKSTDKLHPEFNVPSSLGAAQLSSEQDLAYTVLTPKDLSRKLVVIITTGNGHPHQPCSYMLQDLQEPV
jgi:hypothetical protein